MSSSFLSIDTDQLGGIINCYDSSGNPFRNDPYDPNTVFSFGDLSIISSRDISYGEEFEFKTSPTAVTTLRCCKIAGAWLPGWGSLLPDPVINPFVRSHFSDVGRVIRLELYNDESLVSEIRYEQRLPETIVEGRLIQIGVSHTLYVLEDQNKNRHIVIFANDPLNSGNYRVWHDGVLS